MTLHSTNVASFPNSINPSLSSSDNASIILMIGDGMGPEQLNLARLVEGNLTIDDLIFINTLTTESVLGTITDSAAAATTLSTGIKTINGYLGLGACAQPLETILEAAQAINKSTGVVTTTEITHATPAAFTTHIESRNEAYAIAQQLVTADVDVLLGGNDDIFSSEQLTSFSSNNYDIVTDLDSLQAASSNKLLGLFAPSDLPYVFERNASLIPSLPLMTEKALNTLSRDSDGFFLMIEGGRIDHASHNNNHTNVALETIEFDQAIKVAKQYIDSHPNTLLIVTGDHETGGLSITGNMLNNSLPTFGMTNQENMSLRVTRANNVSVSWASTSHTATQVPLYYFGTLNASFTSAQDNTDVYPIMRSFYSLSPENSNPDIPISSCTNSTTPSGNLSLVNFASFFGGSGLDQSYSIAIDNNSNIYIAGWTDSPNFPTTINAYQRIRSSAAKDVFIVKISTDGSRVIFSTLIGGTDDSFSSGSLISLVIDSNNNPILGASTSMPNFPTTSNALNSSINGDRDIIVAKISSDGSDLLYSTFIGGSGSDSISGLALDKEDNIFFTGQTESNDFPVTQGVYSGGLDAYVAKLSNDGSTLEFASYYGGTLNEAYPLLALDEQNNLWIGGSTTSTNLPTTPDALNTSSNGGNGWYFGSYLESIDLFMAKFSSTGSLLYSSYLGGSKSEYINALTLDSLGNPVISGSTGSSDFPITTNVYDPVYDADYPTDFVKEIFVTKIATDGSEIIFSTYFGGVEDYGFTRDMILDKADYIYLTGWTGSNDFPLSVDAIDSSSDPDGDGFLSVLSPNGRHLNYSSFIGGLNKDEAYGLALDNNNNVYITGTTFATDFPLIKEAMNATHNGNEDIFILRLDLQLNLENLTQEFPKNDTTTIAPITSDTTSSTLFISTSSTTEFFPPIWIIGVVFPFVLLIKRKRSNNNVL